MSPREKLMSFARILIIGVVVCAYSNSHRVTYKQYKKVVEQAESYKKDFDKANENFRETTIKYYNTLAK